MKLLITKAIILCLLLTATIGSTSASNNGCPTYGFNINGQPNTECVELRWWALSTQTQSVDENLNYTTSNTPQPKYFTIQYRKYGEIYWTYDTRGNTSHNSHILSGLDACTKYEIRMITTCNNNANSIPTGVVRVTTGCFKPTNLAITNITNNAAKVGTQRQLNTYPCSNAQSVVSVVEYKAGNGNWNTVNCNQGSPCVLYNLTPGTKYRVRVKYQYGLNIYSAYTNEASFTTTGTKPTSSSGSSSGGGTSSSSGSSSGSLKKPNLFYPVATHVTSSFFELSWEGIIGATSYEIIIATKSNFSNGRTYTSSTNRYRPSGLPASNVYFWKVRAKGPSGKQSFWSASAKFTI